MEGIKVAWRGWRAAWAFLFWTVVEAVTRAVYWHKEASRELLILKPRRPKDLYDEGYALFAFDISIDGWVGHWRAPSAKPGTPANEVYCWKDAWDGIPFHEVEFSDMPSITFKVRAVSLEWCRQHLDGAEIREALAKAAAARDAAVERAEALAAAQATRH